MLKINLESGKRIDNFLFEIFLESSGREIPMAIKLVKAIELLEQATIYPIQSGYETVLPREDYLEGVERLFRALKEELNANY